MEFLTEFAAMPAFVVITYLAAELFKKITKDAKNELLPALCGLFGAVLGTVAFFTVPMYIAATNLFEAIAIGVVSGFAATGINQVYKQLSNNTKG